MWPHVTITETNASQRISVIIAGDDQHLTLNFWAGAPAGSDPCDADYQAPITQSKTAIVITISVVDPQPLPSGTYCTADLHPRNITTRTDQPVGNRVLIDDAGVPLTGKRA